MIKSLSGYTDNLGSSMGFYKQFMIQPPGSLKEEKVPESLIVVVYGIKNCKLNDRKDSRQREGQISVPQICLSRINANVDNT